MALLELSAAGEVLWARSFGGPNEETAAGLALTIAATDDGDIVAGGGCFGVIDFAGDVGIGGFAVKWTP